MEKTESPLQRRIKETGKLIVANLIKGKPRPLTPEIRAQIKSIQRLTRATLRLFQPRRPPIQISEMLSAQERAEWEAIPDERKKIIIKRMWRLMPQRRFDWSTMDSLNDREQEIHYERGEERFKTNFIKEQLRLRREVKPK